MKKIVCLLLVGTSVSSEAQLMNYAGIRARSMGGAFTAVSNDCTAVFWNPAGMTKVKDVDLEKGSIDYNIADIYGEYYAILVPLKKYSIGAGMNHMWVEDWLRDADGNKIGTFVSRIKSYNFAFAFDKSENTSWGLIIKGLHEQLHTDSNTEVAFDVGMIKYMDKVNLAIAVKDVVITGFEGNSPSSIKIGASYKNGNQMIATDLHIPAYGEKSLKIGIENNFFRHLYFWFGFTLFEEEKQLSLYNDLTAGIGLDISGLRIIYQESPGLLETTHRIAIGMNFNKFTSKEKDE